MPTAGATELTAHGRQPLLRA